MGNDDPDPDEAGTLVTVRAARLSVIVLTDQYETIRRVVEHLCTQSIAEDVELVVGCPSVRELDVPEHAARALAGVTVVEVPLLPMGPARAAVVRAAHAPVIVLGETHAFPARDWAEHLLRAHAGPARAVAPGMHNANPRTARSWSGFLMDYGRWLAENARGKIHEPPAYNASWKRDALLGFSDRLALMLEPGGPLEMDVSRDNTPFEQEPAAGVAHLNVVRPLGAWAAERYWGGRLFGSRRSRDWRLRRRFIYFGGSVLVPLIRLVRTRSAMQLARQSAPLPKLTLMAIAAGSLLWAFGEAMGYIAGEGRAEERMLEYELHKERYA
jgi:hypothetical protein